MDKQLKEALETIRECTRPALIFSDEVKPLYKLIMENDEAIGVMKLLWAYLESQIENNYREEGKHYRDTMVECIDRSFNKVRRFLEDAHDYLCNECELDAAKKMVEERGAAKSAASENGSPKGHGENSEEVTS